jgi:hypothetical protein
MTARSLRWPALLTAALLLAGCAPGRGQVSGKVKYKGQPLPNGTITFYDQKNNTVSSAIGPDGSYSVQKVVAGPVKISVMVPMDISFMGEKLSSGPKAPALPAKYSDQEKSGLDFEVKAGDQVHDVNLD